MEVGTAFGNKIHLGIGVNVLLVGDSIGNGLITFGAAVVIVGAVKVRGDPLESDSIAVDLSEIVDHLPKIAGWIVGIPSSEGVGSITSFSANRLKLVEMLHNRLAVTEDGAVRLGSG